MNALPCPNYIRRGAGGKLLLIQGASAGQQHWGGRFLTALSSRCEVVAYDPPGIGDSPSQYDNVTMAGFADDAARVLDHVGWERANVLGVSVGGVVAQELVLRHPERVERMILCGTNGGGSATDASRAVVDGSLVSAVVHGDRTATSQNLFRLGVKDPDTVAPEAWLEYQVAELVPVDPRASVLQMVAYARHSTMGRLLRLRLPTLVLHGDSDRIIDLNDAIALTQAISGAQLAVLSAGHFFWLEIPVRTAQLVADFCAAGLYEELSDL